MLDQGLAIARGAGRTPDGPEIVGSAGGDGKERVGPRADIRRGTCGPLDPVVVNGQRLGRRGAVVEALVANRDDVCRTDCGDAKQQVVPAADAGKGATFEVQKS